MRVLLGVCGLGFGHSVRQSCILDVLLERGCSVVVFAFASSHAYFSKHFGGRVPVIEVKVPWVVCLADGIDWTQTHARNRSDYGAISATTNRAFASAIELLGGLPDLCISDYEPTTAQFAYLHDIPLVTIDQQSKFLGYRTQDVDGYCRNEERARLAYFFPSASQRFALSYFPLDAEADSQFDVTVLPAIVRPGVHALSRLPSPPRTRSIVVYLSPYDKTGMYRDLVGVLRRFKDYEFHIYDLTATQSILPEPDCPSHLSFRCFNEQEFLRAVWRAQGVISTAGFTLLSELAYLRKPAFTVPLPTYDQHFHMSLTCARANLPSRVNASSMSSRTCWRSTLRYRVAPPRRLAHQRYRGFSPATFTQGAAAKPICQRLHWFVQGSDSSAEGTRPLPSLSPSS